MLRIDSEIQICLFSKVYVSYFQTKNLKLNGCRVADAVEAKEILDCSRHRLMKGEFSGENLEFIDNSKLLSSSGLDSQLDLSSAFCLSISVR